MKKIENIIDNCIDCRFAERYNHPDVGRCAAFICKRMNPQRLAGFSGPSGVIDIPDWCPLETYNEVEKSEVQPESVPCYIGQSKATECQSTPSTIILPGMPSLEWMSENLSGHGGTEVDGNWYYTWDQAMSAAAELGDGWRLPKREEFEKLSDIDSTWDDKRKGRLFGGKLFFPAAGRLYYSSAALELAGTYGCYWSSSPYSAGSTYAGCLYFSASGVYPFNNSNRAHGFSVRCVREIRERI